MADAVGACTVEHIAEKRFEIGIIGRAWTQINRPCRGNFDGKRFKFGNPFLVGSIKIFGVVFVSPD